ncbi:hypothetical protein MIZ03_4292 [Rhodoferax lithotrophicus]|uniref:Uncharacterized protein n=1 Tax=Rhodoferax lithotrophicus TaxID=2798804 RepID=A0ABM7MSK5_9BURK|nr:hypothetical protein MIZ03_4292 [Rhodoferax sp. MIZ03]
MPSKVNDAIFAIQLWAAQNGRSAEAKIRHMVEKAIWPQTGMGTALVAIRVPSGTILARGSRPCARSPDVGKGRPCGGLRPLKRLTEYA